MDVILLHHREFEAAEEGLKAAFAAATVAVADLMESGRMVHLREVGEFVADDIVAQVGRQKDADAAESDDAARVAAAQGMQSARNLPCQWPSVDRLGDGAGARQKNVGRHEAGDMFHGVADGNDGVAVGEIYVGVDLDGKFACLELTCDDAAGVLSARCDCYSEVARVDGVAEVVESFGRAVAQNRRSYFAQGI